jgi:hypothetical protein
MTVTVVGSVVWGLLFHIITSGQHILMEWRPCRCAPSPARDLDHFRQYAKLSYVLVTAIIPANLPVSVPGILPANFWC